MKTLAFTILLALLAQPGVGITKGLPTVTLRTVTGPVTIDRIEKANSEISGEWALT